MNDSTINYYNVNAERFVSNTIDANMQVLYDIFLPYIPVAGKILDAGCGSGRDTKYFLSKGYDVIALDASEKLVEISSLYTGQKTEHYKFTDISYIDLFDGIWACASLIHVSRSQIDDVMKRLCNALKDNGVLFASFKYGDNEEHKHGRFFNNYNEISFNRLLINHSAFNLICHQITEDVRPSKKGEYWLNVLLKKSTS